MYEFDQYKILVDVGLSTKQVEERLKKLDVDLSSINVIFITHEHSDHIKGLKVLSGKIFCDIYATLETADSCDSKRDIVYISPSQEIMITDDLKVKVLKTSHDAANSIGFKFTYNKHDFIHMTDTGYVTKKIIEETKNAYAYTVESNYEDSVLMVNDKYPFSVKKRILSDKGHLSNKQCNDYLLSNIGEKTKHIIFAHLSENNNAYDLVEMTNQNIEVDNKVILSKNDPLKVELCK